MASVLFTTILVCTCVCVCLAAASPSKKDNYGGGSVKKVTSTTPKPVKAKCDTVCPDDYTPICANEKGSTEKAKSFGNVCVMNKYNCEHNTHLVQEHEGECKNGSGVRLA